PIKIGETIGKELPKSARAILVVGRSNQGGGAGGQVQVELVGDSTETLSALATDIVPILARNPELTDVRIDTGDQNSELKIRVDRERAASFGFSTGDVAQFVSLALRGAQLRDFKREQTEVPVWVRFQGAENYGVEDIASFTVRTADGRTVPLMAMVDVSVQPAATQIRRTNRQTRVTILANLAGETTVPDARKVMEQTMESVAFPPGYSYTFDGSAFESESEAQMQML